jgi:hypothetical protein
MNYLRLTLLFLVCVIVGCGEDTKREWGVLQQAHAEQRLVNRVRPEIVELHDQLILVVNPLRNQSKGPVCILLTPTSSPFYKQIPERSNFVVDGYTLELLGRTHRVDPTVLACIRSHIDEDH